jgi:DoxX-like family
MTAPELRLLKASLAAVWLLTAFASAWEAHGRSAALLQAAGVDGTLAAAMLWGGVALDLALGLALWLAPTRLAATGALAATLVMTAITTAVLPSQWLDPLGSLSKNLPILAALWLLRRHAHPRQDAS